MPGRPRRQVLGLGLSVLLLLLLLPALAVALSFPGKDYFTAAGSSLGLIDDDPRAAGSDQDGGVSTGTTMVAAKYRDGVIVGADSRSVKSKLGG